jgi:hypothetical protein
LKVKFFPIALHCLSISPNLVVPVRVGTHVPTLVGAERDAAISITMESPRLPRAQALPIRPNAAFPVVISAEIFPSGKNSDLSSAQGYERERLFITNAILIRMDFSGTRADANPMAY